MTTITAGVIAMLLDDGNYGRLVHVDEPHPTAPGVWVVSALQTVTLACDITMRIDDYPSGTKFIALASLLRPFGGLDAGEEARDALPNSMAPKRQLEHAR